MAQEEEENKRDEEAERRAAKARETSSQEKVAAVTEASKEQPSPRNPFEIDSGSNRQGRGRTSKVAEVAAVSK